MAPSSSAGPGRSRARPCLPGPVVLGVSDTDLAAQQPAMRLAVREAERRNVPLLVLHASGDVRSRTGSQALHEQHVHHLLGLAAHHVRELARVGTDVTAVHSPLHPVAALLAASRASSLLVLQVRVERQDHAARPGPVVRAVVRQAACPALVLHGGATGLDGRDVVVGVESRRRDQTCVRVAVDEALRADLPLVAVHAWMAGGTEPPVVPADLERGRLAAQGLLDDATADVPAEHPLLRVRRWAVRGTPVDALRAYAREAALLVVARNCAHSLDLDVLGRTASALLRRAPCPVVLTPPFGPPVRDADPGLLDLLRSGQDVPA